MKIHLLVLTLFFFSFSFAQKQGNIWYFGTNAGINFNTSPPSALTDGAIQTDEGCASIADNNGHLLFYTDGITVFNKQHQVMANGSGLAGNKSATQSTVIVPYPLKDNLFYIITSDALENTLANGYTYSLVDINGDGGLGEIIEKNQLLYAPSTEKLAIARHSNGKDWWVITKQWGNNRFNVYLIDHNGLHTSPISSDAGTSITSLYQTPGCLQVSPDNKKIAMASYGTTAQESILEVFDFDNRTGQLRNPIKLPCDFPYGVAFSPNSNYLYISTQVDINDKPRIDQFDISAGTDAATIESTRITITPPNHAYVPMGMQLGPDNKIYVNNTTIISIIHTPDNKGAACGFQVNGLDLKGRLGGIMFPSVILPPAAQSQFDIAAHIKIIERCKREVQLEASSNQLTNITYHWQLGNGLTSTQKAPRTVYPFSKDVFEVKLEITADVLTNVGLQRQTKTLTKEIRFAPLPKAEAGDDLIVEKGEPFVLKGSGGGTYEWSPIQFLNSASLQHPTAVLFNDQTFTVRVTNTEGCTDEDQVHVKVYDEPDLFVPSGFSPNGDGKNDVLRVVLAGVTLNRFQVYNRWGNLVFTTSDPVKGWNGRYNSMEQPQGHYIWMAEATDLKGRTIIRKGTTYLLR